MIVSQINKMFNFINCRFDLLICLVFLCSPNFSFAQDLRGFPKSKLHERIIQTPAAPVFEKIIEGIEAANVSIFAHYFGKQVYISLNSGERGYYSSNQAYYVLQNYLNIYKPINFKISTRLLNSITPYCAGRLVYNFKGVRETVQVYISLTLTENNWEITQITFN